MRCSSSNTIRTLRWVVVVFTFAMTGDVFAQHYLSLRVWYAEWELDPGGLEQIDPGASSEEPLYILQYDFHHADAPHGYSASAMLGYGDGWRFERRNVRWLLRVGWDRGGVIVPARIRHSIYQESFGHGIHARVRPGIRHENEETKQNETP